MTNIILAGNPNTGKTTLFNSLCKTNNHVGNWHGVTVQVSSKKIVYKGNAYTIFDLPGIYSLNNFSKEEQVATTFLKQNKSSTVINIVDANNLGRNLLLTLQLIENGYNVILAINMASEVPNLNVKLLQKALKIPVVLIDARKPKSVQKLLLQQPKNGSITHNFAYEKLLTNNAEINNKIRFDFIDKLLQNCGFKTSNSYGLCRLDKILINKYFALPIFLFVMLLVFVITFGAIGNNLSIIFSNVFNYFSDLLNDLLCKTNISAWAHALIMQGVVGGIGVVISFLPQVTLLFLCMNFLEDIGYLSRVAIMFDGMLKKVGLTGKSIFSLLMGFGCTTTAMLTTRSLDSVILRKRTAMVIPFASCSAKLPVYALICSAFFIKNKALMVFLLYVFGITIGLVVSLIASKISHKKADMFVMELPPIRVPSLKKTAKNLLTNVFNFIKRIGGTLVLCSIIFWILSNLSFSFKYVSNTSDSIIYGIANFLYPIFKPLGFKSPLIVVALLVGVVAKEMIVSCLAISNGVVGSLGALATSLTLSASAISFTPASAVAFLVFILLYSPCISAISVTAKEISAKFALFVFVFQFALAYVVSLLVYNLINLAISQRFIEFAIILLVLAFVLIFVIKYIRKKRGCTGCKGTYCGKTCMQKTK